MRFVFLDRDGVINRFPGKGKYVTTFEDFKIFPKAIAAIKQLSAAGYKIAIISNQGCVSRKLITKNKLSLLTKYLLQKIRKAGGRISGVYYCYHQTADACDCKKPKTRLLQQAVKNFKIDKKQAFFIGDSEEDMGAARNFGCQSILVLSGRTKRKDLPAFSVQPDHIHKNLWEAARWVVRQKK